MNQLAPGAFDRTEIHRRGPLRVLSTCSGVSAASVAFEGLPIEIVAYAEIDAFACHVLHHRLGVGRPRYMPDPDAPGLDEKERRARRAAIKAVAKIPAGGVPNFGDLTQISDDDLRRLGRIDMLEGGTPCQAFSVAGLRRGLADERGNLTLEFCRLAQRMWSINDLEFVLWENVRGALSDRSNAFGCLLAGLVGHEDGPLFPPGDAWTSAGHVLGERGETVAWRVLDAQYFGVPQRRARVFAVASFGAVCAGDVLPEPAGEGRRPEAGSEAEAIAAAGALAESFGVLDEFDFELPAAFALNGHGTYSEKALPSLRRSGGDVGKGGEALVVTVHPAIDGTLCASGAGLSRASGQANEGDLCIVQQVDGILCVRRLMPIECERLQGFPDNWTAVPYTRGKPAADEPRYKGLGNSMAVPVMAWIAGRLLRAIARQRVVDRVAVQRALLAAA